MALNTAPFEKVNPKSEFWKYTPKKEITSDAYQPMNISFEEFSNATVYIGPSPNQIQTLSWKELEADGYISLSKDEVSLQGFDFELERAEIDSTLTESLSNYKPVCVTFLKNLPSNLWLNANSLHCKTNFKLINKCQLNLFITEQKASFKRLSLLNFTLAKDCLLDVAVSLSEDSSSWSRTDFYLEENSSLNSFSLLQGGSPYKRYESACFMKGKNSTASLNGLSLPQNASVFDYHSDVFHLNKSQQTEQKYNSINQGTAKSIFMGRVHLTENSNLASVEQLNQNLLLSKKASVDAQPELNIYQDDVKATHGSTTGSLDPEHFFYLHSRGFNKEQSKEILLKGFSNSTFQNLNSKEFKSYLSETISAGL